jgi:small membrane protein
MLPIQFLLITALLVALAVTWRRVRGGVIRPIEGIGWTVAWIAAGIVIARPDATSMIANLVGVGRGVDLVLYAAVIALFFLVFRIFIAVDRVEREITDVVRREALKDLGQGTRVKGQARPESGSEFHLEKP